jgi:ATP-dependent DNA ligase
MVANVPGMVTLITPVERTEPFDHPDWLFEVKFDGFRAAADTVRGRLISRKGNRMQRYEEVLDFLPKGHVSDASRRDRNLGPVLGADRGAKPAPGR